MWKATPDRGLFTPAPVCGSVSPHCEKIAQELCSTALAKPSINFGPVVTGRLCEDAGSVIHAPALLVGCAVIEASEPRKRDRPRTHRARLQRHIEIAARQPFRSQRRAGLPDREKLGVSRRVFQFEGPVPRPRDNPPLPIRDDRADRHLAARGGRFGFLESQVHRTHFGACLGAHPGACPGGCGGVGSVGHGRDRAAWPRTWQAPASIACRSSILHLPVWRGSC